MSTTFLELVFLFFAVSWLCFRCLGGSTTKLERYRLAEGLPKLFYIFVYVFYFNRNTVFYD